MDFSSSLLYEKCQKILIETCRKTGDKVPHIAFCWGTSKRNAGTCTKIPGKITMYRIEFSQIVFPLLSEEQQIATIIHEICHALVFSDGHGHWWAHKMIVCGLAPERCYSEKHMAPENVPLYRALRTIRGKR